MDTITVMIHAAEEGEGRNAMDYLACAPIFLSAD
jgi:hypothetical protein